MQKNTTSRCAILLLVVCAASGCSRTSARAASSANAQPNTSSPAGNDDVRGSVKAAALIDCNKLFSSADVANLLPGAVAVSTYADGDNACVFRSADSSLVRVSGDGVTEEALWTDTELNQRDKYYRRIGGLGDEALFKASYDGAQVYVKKGDQYCGIVASIHQSKLTGEPLARRLGDLCNKVFATR